MNVNINTGKGELHLPCINLDWLHVRHCKITILICCKEKDYGNMIILKFAMINYAIFPLNFDILFSLPCLLLYAVPVYSFEESYCIFHIKQEISAKVFLLYPYVRL